MMPARAMGEIEQNDADEVLRIRCKACRQEVALPRAQTLLKLLDNRPVPCPACGRPIDICKRVLGCPYCRRPFFVHEPAVGDMIRCPHCDERISLPTPQGWADIDRKPGPYEWRIISARTGRSRQFYSLKQLTEAARAGEIVGADLCCRSKTASPEPLREICDWHPQLRKLYDPVGALRMRASTVVATAAGYLAIAGGFVLGGWVLGPRHALGAAAAVLAHQCAEKLLRVPWAIARTAIFLGVAVAVSWIYAGAPASRWQWTLLLVGPLICVAAAALAALAAAVFAFGAAHLLIWLACKLLGIGRHPELNWPKVKADASELPAGGPTAARP